MRIWYNHLLENHRYVAEVLDGHVRIGRRQGNDIVLDSPFIGEEAIALRRGESDWEVEALGTNGCRVGDTQVRQGDRLELRGSREITLFPFKLELDLAEAAAPTEQDIHRQLEKRMSELIREIHGRLLSAMDCCADEDARRDNVEYLLILERKIEEIARLAGISEPANEALVGHMAGCAVRSRLIEQLISESGNCGPSELQTQAAWSRMVTIVPDREQELIAAASAISATLGLREATDLSRQMDAMDAGFWKAWTELSDRLFDEFRLYLALCQLKKQIKDTVFGYGPLEDLLRTPAITEIMVVSRDHIYIEKNGVVENSGRQFVSDEVTETIIERIVSKVGRRIDKSQPLVDARLTDGSRVNAVISPLAVSGPTLTIRKFPLKRLTIEDLIRLGSITPTVAEFLRATVIAANILISGGTGSGKTTLLNCLGEFIPLKERIVTIEDTAELQLHKDHVVRMETKRANVEGTGAFTIHDLVRNALRMRPDRIIVGECRGEEAVDMLQAMNTGHDGSLTTIHANSAADVILRLEVMVQSAAAIPLGSVHRQIASAIDLVVHIARMRDGSRRICQITEFVELDEANETLRTKDLFSLTEEEGELRLCPTGRLPTFMGELIEHGLLCLDTFYR